MIKKTCLWLIGLALLPSNLPARTDCDKVKQIPTTECEALLALYDNTNGKSWINHKNWVTNEKPCTWYGVRCEDKHVTYLDLAKNQLKGSLPAELSNLTELNGFELHTNQLNGTIPPELGQLAKLKSLYLYTNQLNGTIPPELGDLNRLKHLHLNDNKLCGNIPPELLSLTRISTLNLKDNHLTATDPALIGWLDEHNLGWEQAQTPCPNGTTLQFSSGTYSVKENKKEQTISVARIGDGEGAVTVDYATSNGTATAPDDYTKTSGTLNWSDGNTSNETFKVVINDDDESEVEESIGLALKNPTGGADIGEPDTAVLTIIDDETPPIEHGTLRFTEDKYSVNETDKSITINVERVGGSEGKVTVKVVTKDGTAKKGKDYKKTTKKLQWKDGDTKDKPFKVTIFDDDKSEGSETINLHLKKATGGAKTGDPSVLTINDETQTGHGTLQFSKSEYRIDENKGTVNVIVNRVNGSDGTVSVKYATSDNTATAGSDYAKTSGKLKWDDGDANDKTIKIKILDNPKSEPDENFKVSLSDAKGGADLGKPTKVTIIDNDEESGICTEVTQIPTSECEALVALYKSTNGAHWNANTNWKVTEMPCSWYGVACSVGHISRLSLYSNNLDGEIPAQLGDLTELQRLFLFENKLSGNIPAEFVKLTRLQYLWLDNNKLSGDVPEGLMETSIPAQEGYLQIDNNCLETSVSESFEIWLNERSLGWEDSQNVCK